MRVAVISDIHGNLPALRAMLDAADGEGVDAWICLGDVVGYYYWPAECLALLDERRATVIAGNHERFLQSCRGDPARLEHLTGRYGHGLQRALECLGEADLDRLAGLPERATVTLGGVTLALCHGAPWDGDAYVYPDAPPDTQARMVVDGAAFTLFGHTHYPVCWPLPAGQVVNPGSVGQPRDRRPGACWALLDLATRRASLRREAYDPEPVLAECRLRDPGLAYLQHVLTRTAHDASP